MLDIKLFREDADAVKKALKARGLEAKAVDEVLKLDGEWRKVRGEADGLNAQRNAISIEIGKLKKAGKDAKKELAEIGKKGKEIEKVNEKADQLRLKIDSILITLPNIPDKSVPVGEDASKNKLIRKWGEPKKLVFKPREHFEIGEKLGMLDFERGVKMAGHRFAVLKGDGAKLERALINFMLDFQAKRGYAEHMTPHLVNEKAMTGTGQLPKFEEELYKIERDGLYLIPTAEVTLTNMHADENLKEEELPLNYCAYTPCYRREAGAYGKDVRGILRQHQFNKVELVKVVKPEDSGKELEKMVGDASGVLEALGIPYRFVELCTGDLGFAAAKTYDIEVWLPGQALYREISSCSNCTDFQARRMNMRMWRRSFPAGMAPLSAAAERGKGKLEHPHTLNGSGLAVGRTMIAILENFQQQDGSVLVPAALVPYFGKKTLG